MSHAPPLAMPHSTSLPEEARAVADRMAGLELFSTLGSSDLACLARGARHRHLGPGKPLWRAGERAAHFAVIESGIIEIRQTTLTGDGVVVGLFRTGEAVGLAAVLEHGLFPADAIAIGGAVDVLSIRADALQEALETSVTVGFAINRALLQHTAALRAKIDIVSAGSVPRRLAALMIYLIERFGRPTGAEAVVVEVNLSREEISQLVSARAETVIRILSRWQKAGWLTSRPGGMEITRADMLRRILDT
ncbi:Crp/Fnr family transcriptional regulator [Aromatoleum aromaticum]|nr:Crp/Fnr family transcriptional regulator [Aromatoleum aromaticum]